MDLGTPLHRKVSLVLADGIATGRYAPGEALPAEAALAKMFEVSRVTIRRALADLDDAGLIDRRHGRGTFVKAVPAANSMRLPINGLTGQIAKAGRMKVDVVGFDYVPAPPDVGGLLGLPADALVQRAVRVRHKDDRPILHLTTYVPEAVGRLYTRKDLTERPLYELLTAAGKSYKRVEQSVGACLADPIVAPLLRVEIGSPLLLVKRLVSAQDDRPVEYLEIQAPPALYQIMMAWDVLGDDQVKDGKILHYETRL